MSHISDFRIDAVNFEGLAILLFLMEMKCLKPKTQKHETNIVKYSCQCEGNSSLNILNEETILQQRGSEGGLRME